MPTNARKTRIYVLNTGGTLGMVGTPLRAAKSAAELMDGILVPKNVELTLDDFKIRQDSTNLLHAERVMIARQLATKYQDFDAFVVMHGTDSLAETTAALSMFYKNSLQKPIIVVGAQMTKDEVGSDVHMQLSNTFRICRSFDRNNVVGVYNVCIGDVWDGSRLKKRAESNFMAFYTPGRNPVARVWPHVHFEEGMRHKDPVLAVQNLRLDSELEKKVGTIRVSADTPPWMLMDMIEHGRLKGVILECKGAGQIPNREWTDYQNDTTYSWIDAIAAATKAGIHVGILSPFEDGRVILNRYELGALAEEAGAISMESLTPDMADVKFRHAIALWPDDRSKIQEFISTNIVGELLTGMEDRE